MNLLIKILLGLLTVLADFIILYFIWGIIQSMRLTKYAKFNKLKKEEVKANKKLHEIEIKLENLETDKQKEQEQRNNLILENYHLQEQKSALYKELLENVKSAIKEEKIKPEEITSVDNEVKEKVVNEIEEEKKAEELANNPELKKKPGRPKKN